MPWLTPDSIPEGDDCRPLSIPASTDWLALVSGALTELTKPYNWQQFGSLTVQETVDKMQEIVDGYYAGGCTDCTLEGGGRVIRITTEGKLEELGEDGTWQEPTGDYVIPPPEPRTEGTEPDQNCLAAKNAVNVLQQLYENLSDSFSSGLSEAEALTAFTLALIGLVGFEFAPITGGIIIFFTAVFSTLYSALAYLTADLWDDDVSQQITCFLLACANNVDGVVTFDWDCFVGQLNSLTNAFDLTADQIRLYAQITFILYFIGGVDGLNLAGRTTAITDDDCTVCSEWCRNIQDESGLDEWDPLPWNSSSGETLPTYSGGLWHNGQVVTGTNVSYIHLRREFLTPTTLTDAAEIAQTGADHREIWVNGDGSLFSGTKIWADGFVVGTPFPIEVDSIDIVNFTLFTLPALTLGELQFSGIVYNPFGDSNC